MPDMKTPCLQEILIATRLGLSHGLQNVCQLSQSAVAVTVHQPSSADCKGSCLQGYGAPQSHITWAKIAVPAPHFQTLHIPQC